jgi:hypothetical protein
MLEVCPKNRIEFRYVLNEVWYASSENMSYIKRELEKEFIMPLKSNRKVALSRSLSLEEKKRGESTSNSGLSNWRRARYGKFTWSKWSSRCFWSSESSRTRTVAKVCPVSGKQRPDAQLRAD